ncbi:hypothetical protein ACFLT1_00530 [Bacteroidota bacterium]
MRNIVCKIVTVVIFVLSANSNLVFSQTDAHELPDRSGEVLHLFTDRDLYSVSEKIYFSVVYSLDTLIELENWSEVLYVELIKWNGAKISQSKVPIKKGLSAGYLEIPENIYSGNYYLRAYTSWMRNYSPYLYKYFPVKVINPNTDEIDLPTGGTETEISFVKNEMPENNSRLTLSGLKEVYNPRDEVEFSLSTMDKRLAGTYVITVAKSSDKKHISSEYELSGFTIPSNDKKEIEYLPEIKNITLRGSVVDNITKEAIPGRSIALSSTLNPFFFFISTSNSDGDFTFSIPAIYGSHQFCLKSLNSNEKDAEFLISNDFCNKEILLPYIPFKLNEEEKEEAKDIAINAQLYSRYASKDSPSVSKDLLQPFYGSPQEITYTKDFIELIDLKEFFFEIMPEVIVETKSNASSLKFKAINMLSIFPPLILIDNIPVQNDNTVLSIPSKNIDRIELINGGYIVNETVFSGIINIYSKNNNLGGMELNGDERFFTYQLFTDFDTDMTLIESTPDKRSAGIRNLLYFHPGIELTDNQPSTIRFNTGDAKGSYTVTVRGIDTKGSQTIVEQTDIVVK